MCLSEVWIIIDVIPDEAEMAIVSNLRGESTPYTDNFESFSIAVEKLVNEDSFHFMLEQIY